MITAIVNFKLPDGLTEDAAAKLFQETAPRYQAMAGLVRKYYLHDPETGIGGGCYLFEDMAAAKAVFNDDWQALLKEKYGATPDVRYFQTPVIVDNANGSIDVAAA